MNPTAFSIFGIGITWYGIILTTAMVLAVFLSMKHGRAQGFREDDFLDIGLAALPTAIVFARIYYVIFNLSAYSSFAEMINIRQGGLAIHGGLIGGALAGVLVAKYKGMREIKAADVIAPFIALAQSIGRWGNFVNQEAYGGPTDLPWAITIDGVKVHPTFLYESIWDFLVFVFLIRLSRNKKFDGQVTALYMILYSAGRFFIESLRTDSLMLGSLRAAQVASIAMIVVGVVLILSLQGKGIQSPYRIGVDGSNHFYHSNKNKK